jgi:hypothetical protein
MTDSATPTDNQISPTRARTAAPKSTRKGDVPDAVLDRYLIERDRLGRAERFFRDHRVQAPSFKDHGRRLTADAAYPDAVADMLKIARHRGWSNIRVAGDDAFRREVWIQARDAGLDVKGYRPRERDRAAIGESSISLPDSVHKRLEQAAVVVRHLVPDAVAVRRLLERALDRAVRDRPRETRWSARDRDR